MRGGKGKGAASRELILSSQDFSSRTNDTSRPFALQYAGRAGVTESRCVWSLLLRQKEEQERVATGFSLCVGHQCSGSSLVRDVTEGNMICAFAPWADQSRVQQVVGGQIGEESVWKSDSTEEEGPMNGNILISSD
jgi:hypothetical protein